MTKVAEKQFTITTACINKYCRKCPSFRSYGSLQDIYRCTKAERSPIIAHWNMFAGYNPAATYGGKVFLGLEYPLIDACPYLLEMTVDGQSGI